MVQLLAEEGDQVTAGQVLARIDGDRVRLEAQKQLHQVRKLENNFRRSQELAAQKLVSVEASDQIRYDLESARASYELAKLELSYTNITAPICGVVAQRMVKPGNLIALNAPVFRIVNNSHLEGVLNVPERELARLKAGLPVRMIVDAVPGQVFEGKIDRVSPVMDSGSGTFRVVCAFDNAPGVAAGHVRPDRGRSTTSARCADRAAHRPARRRGRAGAVRGSRQQGASRSGEARLQQRRGR